MKKLLLKISTAISTACASVVVSAQTAPPASGGVSVVDSSVTTQLATTQSDITTVGVALIGLAVIVLGLKWVKAMFF